jgi:hypothetical protein
MQIQVRIILRNIRRRAPNLKLNDKRINTFLKTTEGIGLIFLVFFIAAYLGGLPGTSVLHSEPIFRIPLAILGSVFMFLIVIPAIIIATLREE